MNSFVRKIIKGLPNDFARNAVRDVSLPTAAVFVDIHYTLLPKLFDSKFTAVFLHLHGKLAGIYRSPSEYEIFAKALAQKYISTPSFARNVISELKKHTNWLEAFIRARRSLTQFTVNKKEFFQKYLKFFAYHQATQFGGNYLSKMVVPKNKLPWAKRLVKSLAAAYKYNEMVVPDLEKYFRRLNVTEFLPEEIGDLDKTPVGRSVIGFSGHRYPLTESQARALSNQIEKRQKLALNIRIVAGNPVCMGTYSGKVRLITDLTRLGTVKRGEVLVTTMTRPQYNHILKRAGAIVTDEGGIMDHAAILAREFKIPCVVGTEIATRVFKTGEMVEVDAFKGEVKKINQKK